MYVYTLLSRPKGGKCSKGQLVLVSLAVGQKLQQNFWQLDLRQAKGP